MKWNKLTKDQVSNRVAVEQLTQLVQPTFTMGAT